MNKYATTIKRLITDLTVYKEFLTQKTSLSLKHFIISYSIFSLIISLYVWIVITPQVIENSVSNLKHLQETFPQELVLTIDQELKVSGADSPIAFPFNKPPNDSTNNIAVIDTQAIGEDIKSKDSLFLLTQNTITFKPFPGSQEISILPWTDLNIETTIDKNRFISEVDSVITFISDVSTYILPISFIFVLFGLLITRIINILIYTLLISSLGMILKRPFPYRSYFNISLYIMTISEVIYLLQVLIYQGSFASLHTITFLGLSLIVLLSLPKAIRVKT